MKLKYKILIFVTVTVSSFFTGCSNDDSIISPINTSTFTYPMNDGNFWKYNYSYILSDFKPDSIRKYITTLSPFTVKVTILYDTVINSVTTKCFQEESIINGATFRSWNYYYNTDSALLLYASRGPSTIMPVDRKDSRDSITIFDPPQKILLYPVVPGKMWNPDTYTGYTKKYHSFENVNTVAGNISCMKTERSYSTPTYNYSYFDYYSAKGLLKSYAFFNDMVVTTPQHPEGIGTVDLEVNASLTEINVHP